ncbi:MAG: hypothetical protein IE917_20070 [Betaproteobacteria bacterium]|nr:hypothetical protein [Betaproteobacteria bacterium]
MLYLAGRDPSKTVDGDTEAVEWLEYIKKKCIDRGRGGEFLKRALARPITLQFEGKTSIDVIGEMGGIEGINPDLVAEAAVLASARASGDNHDLDY